MTWKFRLNPLMKFVSSPGPRYLLRLNILAHILPKYLPQEKQTVMEVGAGNGDVTAFLAERSPLSSFHIIESSENALSGLRTRFSELNNVDIISGQLEQANVEPAYTCVLAFEVLEHIEEDEELLRVVSDSLLNDGIFILSVPAYMRKWQIQDIVSGHVRRYERQELMDKLTSAGFSIDEVIDYGFPLTSIMRPIRYLFYRLKSKRTENLTAWQRTEASGVDNRALNSNSKTWVAWILWPFFVLQEIFRFLRFGDGLIVVAKKKV